MIGVIVVILALVLTFAEKPNLFQKPLDAVKLLIVILLIGSAIFSGYKELNSDVQHEKDVKKIDSLLQLSNYQSGQISILNSNVNTFRKETKIAENNLNDTVSSYGIKNKEEVKNIAYRMTSIFSLDTRRNMDAHQRTQNKLDSVVPLRPALINAISEPTNLLRFHYEGDTLISILQIQNKGDLPAYSVGGKLYLVVKIGNQFYNLTRNGGEIWPANLLSGQNIRSL